VLTVDPGEKVPVAAVVPARIRPPRAALLLFPL
jgi:hypothetical protein